jgi:hypothetical protein
MPVPLGRTRVDGFVTKGTKPFRAVASRHGERIAADIGVDIHAHRSVPPVARGRMEG